MKFIISISLAFSIYAGEGGSGGGYKEGSSGGGPSKERGVDGRVKTTNPNMKNIIVFCGK